MIIICQSVMCLARKRAIFLSSEPAKLIQYSQILRQGLQFQRVLNNVFSNQIVGLYFKPYRISAECKDMTLFAEMEVRVNTKTTQNLHVKIQMTTI